MNQSQKQELRDILAKILEKVGPDTRHRHFGDFGDIIVYTSDDYITLEQENTELQLTCHRTGENDFHLEVEIGYETNCKDYGYSDLLSLAKTALSRVRRITKLQLEEEIENLKDRVAILEGGK